jgi:RHS repeat-associated protein
VAFEYDALNRPTVRRNALGQETRYEFDDADRVVAVDLPGRNVYRYAYDGNGNPTTVTTPLGEHTLGYADRNAPSSYGSPLGRAWGWSWNDDNALVSLAAPGRSPIAYAYDGAGRATTTTYSEATISQQYAGATPRLATLTRTPAAGGAAQGFSATWDGMAMIGQSWNGPAQGSVTYGIGSDLLASSITHTAGAATHVAAVVRDDDRLVIGHGPFALERADAGGLVTQIADTALDLDVAYDGSGRLDSRVVAVGGEEIYDEELGYDAAGRLVARTEHAAGVTHEYAYAYDPAGQLLDVRRDGTLVERYAYDGDGNRTSREAGAATETVTFDADDRLQARDATAYTYDAAGFLTGRGADTFIHSGRGELLSATVGGATVTYGHDGMGRRVTRTEGGATEQYFYGNTADALQVTAMRTAAGRLDVFFYDDAGRLYAIQRGTERFYVATDQVGSPRVVSDEDGTVVKEIGYDAYGRVMSDSAPAFVLPIGFAAGLADPGTGLVRFGMRDYDPQAGRWTTPDPLMFAGGERNLYAYAGNSPVAQVDRVGLGSGSFNNAFLGVSAGFAGNQASITLSIGLQTPGIDINAAGGVDPAGFRAVAEGQVGLGKASLGAKLSRDLATGGLSGSGKVCTKGASLDTADGLGTSSASLLDAVKRARGRRLNAGPSGRAVIEVTLVFERGRSLLGAPAQPPYVPNETVRRSPSPGRPAGL